MRKTASNRAHAQHRIRLIWQRAAQLNRALARQESKPNDFATLQFPNPASMLTRTVRS